VCQPNSLRLSVKHIIILKVVLLNSPHYYRETQLPDTYSYSMNLFNIWKDTRKKSLLHSTSSQKLIGYLRPEKHQFHPRTGHEGPEEEFSRSSILSLTSALDGVGGQRHAPAALFREIAGTHCTGVRMGHRVGMEGWGKYRLHRDSIPRLW
jgi:hypothetical protein